MRIIHCLRAPVGGLFRHVCDLARGQAEAGCDVGIICASGTGDALTDGALDAIGPSCALGIKRIAMHRQVTPGDIKAALRVRMWCAQQNADIIHGHGAKGGAYARFAAAARGTGAYYTPHGGSLHYSADTWSGFAFLRLERLLGRFTGGLIFESQYGFDVYRRKVGAPRCEARVIHNGLAPHEFAAVAARPDAADLLFIGELRALKGVDVLLDALHSLRQTRDVTAVIVGDGPDAETFKDKALQLGLGTAVRFMAPRPAREAFALGRILVVPSRAESLPYIVLEALAAAKPTLATRVGGIPEIFGSHGDSLLPAGDAAALVSALDRALADPAPLQAEARDLAIDLASRFTVSAMVRSVIEFYTAKAGTAAPAGTTRSAPATPAK
ncbi:MAG: glycosyltransferase family 4 protein [Hyphomicrobiales bacterium]